MEEGEERRGGPRLTRHAWLCAARVMTGRGRDVAPAPPRPLLTVSHAVVFFASLIASFHKSVAATTSDAKNRVAHVDIEGFCNALTYINYYYFFIQRINIIILRSIFGI